MGERKDSYFTNKQKWPKWIAAGQECEYCGKKTNTLNDCRIDPEDRIACVKCYRDKGSMTLEEFREFIIAQLRKLNYQGRIAPYRIAKRYGAVKENKKFKFNFEKRIARERLSNRLR